MECSWNDGSKTKYYYVIFDQLQGHSEELIWAPESFVRGPLTYDPRVPSVAFQYNFIVQPLVTKEWNARAF